MRPSNHQPPAAYHRGKQARQECRDLSPCPELDGVKAAWWRAGWHDQDMAYGVRWLYGNKK